MRQPKIARWSPDSERVAIVSGLSIVVWDLKSDGGVRRLTNPRIFTTDWPIRCIEWLLNKSGKVDIAQVFLVPERTGLFGH